MKTNSRALAVAMIVASTGFGLLGFAGSASAAGTTLPAVDTASLFWVTLVIGGAAAVAAGTLAAADKKDLALPAGIVAGVLLLVAVGAYVVGAMGGGTVDCAADPTNPLCNLPPDYVAAITCFFETLAAGGPGGAHDASAEFPSGNNFIAADGGTPDYDSTIATPVYGTGGRQARIDIVVDDEKGPQMGTGTLDNTWTDEDAYAFDIHCTVTNAPPGISTAALAVPLWGQISVPYMYGQQGNQTDNLVFLCNAGGFNLGFGKVADTGAVGTGHDANHDFVSYWGERACTSPPLVGDWISLGSSSTASPQNGEWIAGPWFILDTGIISMEETTVTYSIDVKICSCQAGAASNVENLRVDIIATDD